MPDIELNVASITTTSATTAPASGTSETWAVTALATGIRTLPAGQTYALVDATSGATSSQIKEIVRVTAATAGGTSITVTRGADGTTPVAHANPSTFNIVLVASAIPKTGLPSYAPPDLLNTFDTATSTYNEKASNTRNIRAGLADAATGQMSHHIIYGDSVSDGCTDGVTVPPVFDRVNAWPITMRNEIGRRGVPIGGTGVIRAVDASWIDPRWTFVGTWASASAYVYTSTNGDTGTLLPERSGTAVDVWYNDSASMTFTVSVGGATSGVGFASVVCGTTNTYKKVTLLGVNIVANVTTIKITKTGSALSVFTGANVWTPNGGFVVHNVSQSGALATGTGVTAWSDPASLGLFFRTVAGRARTITDAGVVINTPALNSAAGAAFTQADVGKPLGSLVGVNLFPTGTYILSVSSGTAAVMSANALATLSSQTVKIDKDPACIHIALGGNDRPVSITPVATIITAITTIRNDFPNSDCILYINCAQNPSLILDADWQTFAKAMYTLADVLDCVLIDEYDRIGNYALASAMGRYGDNQTHLTSAAYSEWGSDVAEVIAGAQGAPNQAAIQTMTASTTWTKTRGAILYEIECIAGGSGGGSGGRGLTSVIRTGGGGGGGGAKTIVTMRAIDLPDSVAVTVGTGGAGAVGQTVDSTAGTTGTAGTFTSFGTYARANPGTAGGGGQISGIAAAAGAAPTVGTDLGTAGGASSVTGGAGTVGGPTLSSRGATGGGSGGGLTASNVTAAGAAGGIQNPLGAVTGGAGGLAAAGVGGAGPSVGTTGLGGGGGGPGAAAAGGTGGAGGLYGGGGGGGGPSANGNLSGAGGAGGAGACIVTAIF